MYRVGLVTFVDNIKIGGIVDNENGYQEFQ